MAFVVIYDACVLYPAPMRDLLVRLANTGVVRARWSEMILDECFRSILEQRPDLTPQALARTRELMNRAVPDCLVTGFEQLIDGLRLPDPDDRHVLAAAIRAGAQGIVTANLKDSPERSSPTVQRRSQAPRRVRSRCDRPRPGTGGEGHLGAGRFTEEPSANNLRTARHAPRRWARPSCCEATRDVWRRSVMPCRIGGSARSEVSTSKRESGRATPLSCLSTSPLTRSCGSCATRQSPRSSASKRSSRPSRRP